MKISHQMSVTRLWVLGQNEARWSYSWLGYGFWLQDLDHLLTIHCYIWIECKWAVLAVSGSDQFCDVCLSGQSLPWGVACTPGKKLHIFTYTIYRVNSFPCGLTCDSLRCPLSFKLWHFLFCSWQQGFPLHSPHKHREDQWIDSEV